MKIKLGDILFFIKEELRHIKKETKDFLKSEKKILKGLFVLMLLSVGIGRLVSLLFFIMWLCYYIGLRWKTGEWKYHQRYQKKLETIKEKYSNHFEEKKDLSDSKSH